jgi:hypothetical protein
MSGSREAWQALPCFATRKSVIHTPATDEKDKEPP